ncbi:hypothetical protein BDA96_04G007800 [Sorghum bicolor]|uniref:FACT complex subunit n=2 Tax=Sorghum bicolor TaxID=4558 RepID=A0A1Z5RKA6_SORBI|nr:uncharacterized protein LOC8085181 isoform X3 [Sorghum bicolor]KAG0531255.1 hypothetical protein BDA96_04G007800 [Sorghum bicolor]OQU84179.1 hypothetical protein SORBI_3004G007133 [Sorghum bicolor]OQU84180.1 hypothetical protein SORBI_3004G007133 [Sorghum bicolor]|eukprot:XP_021314872.1 uncharacterized protein LOC8085181 isoform X3 [Sorghum bicolor]
MADNGSAKGGSSAYIMNPENFSKRLKVFYDHWNEHNSDLWSCSDAIVIGTPALDDPPHLKSIALEIWLLGYDFPETIIVFMKNQIHVLCSKKKANLIGTLKKAANEAVGADIVLHVKTKNSDGSDLMDDIVRAAQAQSKSDKPVVGHIAKEVDGGKLLETWAAKLSSFGIQPADVTIGFSDLFAVKDTTEVTCVKKAAYLTSSVLKNFVVPKLEKVVDEEKKVSHSSLMFDTMKSILHPHLVKVKLEPDDVEICYPPVFQSGGKFDLKPGASSNDEYLYYDSASVIICALGSKYSSYCSNVARTYLIDATPMQRKAYETLLKAHEAAVEQVKPGNQMSAVYQAAVAVVKRDAPELLHNLTESAGNGIGLEFRESGLDLNANNDGRVKQGMVFNVSLGFHNIQVETTTAEKTKQYSLLLADTVLVNERGPEILTAPCSKAVKDVAYDFSKDAVKIERMKKIMNMKENIRNICIFAPGQANIVKALSSEPTLLAPEMMSDAIATGEEPVALYYRLGKGPRDTFLVNVIHCPEVTDSSMEFNASLSIVDGAFVKVDLNEGLTLQCENFIRQALYESVIPVLCIDVPDISGVLKDLKEGEQVAEAYEEEFYCKLSKLIKEANDIGNKYENKLLDDVTFDPRKANVCFSSSSSGWAFTLDDFARFWSQKLGVDYSLLLERSWGDNFYDPESNKWSTVHTETSKRGFSYYCTSFIMTICQRCLKGDLGNLEALCFGDTVKVQQQFVGKVGIPLYKDFIKKFLPAGRTFSRMIIWKLPSVQRAQQYRFDHLYSGPINDECARAISKCDSKGPLMLYISKIVTDAKTHEPIAIVRVYSGTVLAGTIVNILSPAAEENDAVRQSVKIDPIMWIGKRQQQVKTVHCGNVIGLRGIHQLAEVGCTLIPQNLKTTFRIRPISFYLTNNMQINDVTLGSTCENQMNPSNGTPFSLPYAVYSGLFSHQREGMFWFWRLHCNNTGGILADDMGLGKSRQVSAFLRGLFNSNLISKAIIVAPLSVIYNWKPELTKVGLQSKMFTEGNSKIHLAALENVGKEGGIVLTTYETIRDHKQKISDRLGTVDYIFADEGHRIKNKYAGVSKALKKIKCDHRIVVTGTPIQNNLMEFYTLMKLCNPTLLGKKKEFKENFLLPIDRGKFKGSTPSARQQSIECSEELNKLVSPFVLRRSKMTLKDSGRIKANKYEVIVWVKLSAHQANLYKALMGDRKPRSRKHGGAFEISKVAKSLCLDPSIIGTTSAKNISEQFNSTLVKTITTTNREFTSSKLSFLLYFLPLLLNDKHKILVFSTSPEMLRVLEEALSAKINEEIIRMDGTTTCEDRVKLIDNFQRKDGPPLFLLTTKVGGVGINLTAASRVIIIDPSDNPCDDNQAVDRTYRIGQVRDVIVYRLVTCGTIEEHTYRQQTLKVETSNDVLEGKHCERKISEKQGRVLCVPVQGYDVSQTHLELVKMYGNTFESSSELKRDVDLVKKHRSIFDVFNQSAICLLPKDVPSCPQPPCRSDRVHSQYGVGLLPKEKGTQVMDCSGKTCSKPTASSKTVDDQDGDDD